MLNIGPGELVLIFLVGLLVLGPQKLPEAARQVGRAVAELRRLSSGFQAELRSAMDDEPTVKRSPTPLATPAPTTPTDEMNAALAKARDEAVAAAEASGHEERREAAPAVTRAAGPAKKAAKKAAPAKKKAAAAAKKATKKAVPPKKKAPAKKAPAKKRA